MGRVWAAGRGVDPAIMTALGELVSAGFVRCARSLRAHGVQALDLMSRSASKAGECTCPVTRGKWAGILDVPPLASLCPLLCPTALVGHPHAPCMQ